MSTYFCIVTLTNRPAPLYNVGKLQVRLAYVAVFMAPLTAPYYSIAPQVQIRTLTQGRSWYSYSFMVDICHWPQQLWGLKDCLLSVVVILFSPLQQNTPAHLVLSPFRVSRFTHLLSTHLPHLSLPIPPLPHHVTPSVTLSPSLTVHLIMPHLPYISICPCYHYSDVERWRGRRNDTWEGIPLP